MDRTYLQMCVAVMCALLMVLFPGYTVVARRLPLGSNGDVTGQEKGMFPNKMKENEYLKLNQLDPVDMCFVGCRICFQKDDILLSCVNDLCLRQVIAGQSPANSMWSSICPELDF